MKISTKGRYALRLMLDLAVHNTGELVKIKDISARENISEKYLEQIIEAGLYAANGMGKQATITIAVTNKKLRDRLSAINAKIGGWKEGFDPFYGAPAILIVLADKNWANRVYDGSLVMGNMMLLFVVYL